MNPLATVALLLLAQPVAALAAEPMAADRRSLPAVRVERPPVLDGEIRSDSVWQAVAPSGGFTQTRPEEGRPVSQATEVRVAFDGDALYIGFVCSDLEPDGIVVSDSRRDASLDDTDSVLLILDTYLDEQNGFVFGTNPNALEFDGQLSKAGNLGGFNLNWDGVWEVYTQVGDYGWSAEFRIPFRTLRYPAGDVQTWGVNFQRNIRRRNETAFWSPLGRQFDITRLADAGLLTGVETGRRRNLKFVPYVLGELSDVGEAGTTTDSEVGFDLKYSLTPALTLDLTYNTDFAQVEADELQISLDRFNLFFPEKRPFFLENAGLFKVGRPGQVELFFSRRIGLSEDGEIIPIDYGARVSGGVAGSNVGFIYMETDALAGVAPSNRFGVARINRELPNRSGLGVIYVARDGTGASAGPDDENQTYGVDGRWGIGQYGLISGYFAGTSTPGLDGDDRSWSLEGSWDSPKWSTGLLWVEVGEDFNPEVGFVNRSGGYRNFLVRALRRYRPANSPFGVLEVRPHFSYYAYWDPDGFQETGFLHIDNHIEWKSSYELHTGINFTTEGLQEPFEIYEGIFVPPGTYHNAEIALYGQTNEAARLSFNMSVVVGGFYSGDRVALGPNIRLRLGSRFIGELGWHQNDVDLPEGDFTTQVGRLRLSYSFSPKMALEALLQYNSVDDLFSTNLRFSWLRKANTGLYVVLNDIEGRSRYTGEQPDRSLIVKYTYMFDRG
jgi:hypothetical protein